MQAARFAGNGEGGKNGISGDQRAGSIMDHMVFVECLEPGSNGICSRPPPASLLGPNRGTSNFSESDHYLVDLLEVVKARTLCQDWPALPFDGELVEAHATAGARSNNYGSITHETNSLITESSNNRITYPKCFITSWERVFPSARPSALA